jgi:hypothetical protein
VSPMINYTVEFSNTRIIQFGMLFPASFPKIHPVGIGNLLVGHVI